MKVDFRDEGVHKESIEQVVAHSWSQSVIRQIQLDERFIVAKRVCQLFDLVELKEAELEVQGGQAKIGTLHTPAHVVKAVLAESTVPHVQ